MSSALRRFALTAHIAVSVGWLGAVTAFLALSVVGGTSDDSQTVRAAYIAMDISGRYILVPLSIASLLTGLIQSLGTTWGLFRHYWVIAKLLMNVFASIVLVMYVESLAHLARVAAQPSSAGLDELRASPILHAAAALVLLLVATTLSVYKPRGLTRYGWRKQYEQRPWE